MIVAELSKVIHQFNPGFISSLLYWYPGPGRLEQHITAYARHLLGIDEEPIH